MLDAMAQDAAAPASGDKLDAARKKAAELRDCYARKRDLEEQLKETNKRIQEIEYRELVDLMTEAKLESVTVAPEGNQPRFEVNLADQVHANIPKENEDQAFAYLDKQGMGDMVKTSFTVEFGMGEGKETKKFQAALDKLCAKLGEAYTMKRAVPWNTLTAWVKGEFKAGRPLDDKTMGLLGATNKPVAKVKQPKTEK
jgi:hypothetical protein